MPQLYTTDEVAKKVDAFAAHGRWQRSVAIDIAIDAALDKEGLRYDPETGQVDPVAKEQQAASTEVA